MKLFLVLSVLCGAIVPLSAQESRTVKLRAICFQHVGEVKKLFAVSGGDKPKAVEFDLFTTSFSDPVDVVATDNILTFSMAAAGADGEAGYKVVTTARAVPGPRQLAIFIPGESPEKPYRCFVVDDSKQAFPMGSTMLVNLSNVPFRFSIGEHLQVVAPGKIEKMPMARKTNERGQVPVVISVADKLAEGGWHAVNQTRWLTGADKRDLAISYLHPVTKQPTVNCYADDGQL
jgi:hypothetical protein